MDSIIFSKLFWGIVILLVGVSVIAQAVFKINIPVFKIAFGLLLIYFGIKVLIGSFGIHIGSDATSSIFSSQHISVDRLVDGSEYSSVFGSQRLDFNMVSRVPGTYHIECNAVFGSCELILPSDIQVIVKKNAVFGSVKDPGGNDTNFGEGTYSSDGQAPVVLNIEASAVFGSIQIIRR